MHPSGNSSNLSQLFRGFEALYEVESGLNPHDILVPYAARDGQARELLLFRETDDGDLEVGLAIDDAVLHSLETMDVHDALGDEALGSTLPVIEGLSHLAYLAEAARCERPISGLELETQAEVDKLAICLLHRWEDARSQFKPLVDRLYYRFECTASQELRERYDVANRLALAFSRRLWPAVQNGRLEELRRVLRQFWRSSMSDKHALAV